MKHTVINIHELPLSKAVHESINPYLTLPQVWELTANRVIMVSAIGNDGPLYG